MNPKKIIAVVALALAGSVPSAFSAPLRAPHRAKAPLPEISAAPAPPSYNVVNSLPEGAVAKTMLKSGGCYIMLAPGYSILQQIDGFVANVATLDDKIYVGPIISQADYPLSYMVGTVKDGIATFEFPQSLGYYAPGDEYDYALLYKLNITSDGASLRMCDEQVIKYNVSEDGSLSLLPEYYNCYMTDAVYDAEQSKWYYCGLGDVLLSCTPFEKTPQAFPEGLALEEYNLVSGTQARKVNVGVDGTDIYVSGLYRDLPDGVIKGELKDGKAVFAGGQFLGIDEYFHSCINVYACKLETIEDPEYGVYDALTQLPDGEFEFNVNATLSELSLGDTPIGFAPGAENVGLFTSMTECFITKPEAGAEIKVSKPIIDSYYPPEGVYNAELYFSLLNISADGKLILDKDKFYWCLIMDGEPYPFEPDEYYGLKETADYLPYPYSNGSDIVYFAQYGLQGVLIYPEGYESLGVQAIYKDGDREFRSEVAYAVEPAEDDAIDEIDAAAVSTEYLDLSGRKVSATGRGLLIKRTVNASGAVNTTKIIK